MDSEDSEAANGGFGVDVLNLLAHLNLNSAAKSPSSSSAAAVTVAVCSSAARSKNRRSPSSSLHRKSVSRRANLRPSAAARTANNHKSLSYPQPSPPLPRNPAITETTQAPDSSKSEFLKSPLPANQNDDVPFFTSPLSLPSETYQKAAAIPAEPLPPPSISDQHISPEYHRVVEAARTPSKSHSSDHQDCPVLKDEYENDECGEAVWTEETEGGDLVIHFKCPCGEGYEILLSGNNCYYKLM